MTEVERMFRLLVATITSRSPERLTQPIEVAELYQDIIPYRLYRRELGLETNQDYELTLMTLLSGAGDYLQVDERMRDVLSAQLASAAPDPGVFRQFANARVSISPEALARVAQGGELPPPEPRARPRAELPGPATVVAPEPTGGAMSASAAPEPVAAPLQGSRRAAFTPAPGESCRFCGGRLPAGRAITYCPHCGHDQTVLHCDACGTELEVGWKFCTTCGRKVGGG